MVFLLQVLQFDAFSTALFLVETLNQLLIVLNLI